MFSTGFLDLKSWITYATFGNTQISAMKAKKKDKIHGNAAYFFEWEIDFVYVCVFFVGYQKNFLAKDLFEAKMRTKHEYKLLLCSGFKIMQSLASRRKITKYFFEIVNKFKEKQEKILKICTVLSVNKFFATAIHGFKMNMSVKRLKSRTL